MRGPIPTGLASTMGVGKLVCPILGLGMGSPVKALVRAMDELSAILSVGGLGLCLDITPTEHVDDNDSADDEYGAGDDDDDDNGEEPRDVLDGAKLCLTMLGFTSGSSVDDVTTTVTGLEVVLSADVTSVLMPPDAKF